jgi:hypothetical protein
MRTCRHIEAGTIISEVLGAIYLLEGQGPPTIDGGPLPIEREDLELGKERSEEREGLEEGNRGDLVC